MYNALSVWMTDSSGLAEKLTQNTWLFTVDWMTILMLTLDSPATYSGHWVSVRIHCQISLVLTDLKLITMLPARQQFRSRLRYFQTCRLLDRRKTADLIFRITSRMQCTCVEIIRSRFITHFLQGIRTACSLMVPAQ